MSDVIDEGAAMSLPATERVPVHLAELVASDPWAVLLGMADQVAPEHLTEAAAVARPEALRLAEAYAAGALIVLPDGSTRQRSVDLLREAQGGST